MTAAHTYEPASLEKSEPHNRRAIDNISLRRLCLMGTVVFGASVPHWGTLPVWITLLLAASIGWRIAADSLRLPLPNRPVRVLFAGIAFAAVLFEFRTINGLTAGSALLVVMVSLTFLESRTQRDQLVLMLISYCLVFSGLLYENTALSGAYLLVFVWMTTVGLMQLGRRGDLLRTRATTAMAGRLLLQAVPVMLVLFMLFPRMPGPLWSMGDTASVGATGLSDSMSPGDITNLGLSDEIAFRAEFYDLIPAAQNLYWRGPVLSVFDGRAWTPRQGMWGDASRTLTFSGEPIRYNVSLEPGGRRWAFALEMPADWTRSRFRTLVMRSDYQLVAFGAESINGRLSYDVTSYTQYSANERMTPAQQEIYLRLPESYNPRTEELMRGIREQSSDARDVIARTLDYLRAGEYLYTLTPPPLGRDSVDEFLFATREGFCEHYASAFAVMMRFAGVPARVVTGYQGGELNPFAEYYIIREYNAHAWTEVWLEDAGWVRVDPISAVAPERISLGVSSEARSIGSAGSTALGGLDWARQAALAWDAVNRFWNDWIVGYGPTLQRNLLEWLGFGRLRWSEMLLLSIAAAVTIVVGTAGWLAWQAHTRLRTDIAAKTFARFVRRLQRAGAPARELSEDPAAWGRRAAAALPHQSGYIDETVSAYIAARYEPDPDDRALSRLRELLATFPKNAVRA